MARSFALAGVAVTLLMACGQSPRQNEEDNFTSKLAAFEARARAVSASTDTAETRVGALESRTNRVVQEFGETATAFENARQTLGVASAMSTVSAEQFRVAQTAFEEATQRYRIAAYSIVVLAATAAAAQAICAGRLTTSEFRARNGITDSNVHVDHIWPHARGGLDHPLNYQPLDAHTNMSCGDGCLGAKFVAAPLAFTTGLAVSILGRLGCP